MKNETDASLSPPVTLDALLEDRDVRAGFDEARSVREAAEIIAYWRDHDRKTGNAITNKELARRLGVKPARISALIREAVTPSGRGYGPSYVLMKKICMALGYQWPHGLIEAIERIASPAAPAARVVEAHEVDSGEMEVLVETADHRLLQGVLSQTDLAEGESG